MLLSTQVQAVVDIGSNTVHLLVAEWDGARITPQLTPIDDVSRQSGLASDLELCGTISGQKRRFLAETVAGFARRANSLGAGRIQLFGTEAMRAASNGDELVSAVRAATGLPVHVLEPAEEAYLATLGAALHRRWQTTAMVADIGGASTQFAVADRTMLLGSSFATVGTGRLAARHGFGPMRGDSLRELRDELATSVDASLVQLPYGGQRALELVVAGGAARRLVRLAAANDRKDRPASGRLELGQIERLIDILYSNEGAGWAAANGVSPRKVATTRAGAGNARG